MNFQNLSISEKLVPTNYLRTALQAQKSIEINFQELIEKRKLPENGWPDKHIEMLVQHLASLDSNNFNSHAGLGEREARFASQLVARRHYNFGHGIGRSGDLLEAQPKAAGSTLLANLTNAILLDLIKKIGIPSCQSCFLVPMATGMTLTLCMLSLKKERPLAKYVLWSRIDQKSCFKSITTAGLTPIIIDPQLDSGNCLNTNVSSFQEKILELGSENILCIFSTTSCFAPRNCDDIQKLAELSAFYDIPHLVNNAYGLQSTFLTHQIEQSQRIGRIDLFVQSTDKNLMVPVGGCIVAGFNEKIVRNVAKTYAGRASFSPILDVFMTLLSMGVNGYMNYVKERKINFQKLRTKLLEFGQEQNVNVIKTKANPISLALTLTDVTNAGVTYFGSMLYTRGISGVRVVAVGDNKVIDGYEFKNWGTHSSHSSVSYLTVAASLGITENEVNKFFRKLQECWQKFTCDMGDSKYFTQTPCL